MPDDFNPTEWVTTAEAAELTGYTDSLVRYLARKGRVKGQKFGRVWMIRRKSIEEYADAMRKLGQSKHDPTRAWAQTGDT